jgi:IS605 OrfB family transposase
MRWRLEQRALRKEGLQRSGRRARLKREGGKERRWVRDVLHTVSRRIVDEAATAGQGLALEKLTGIREWVIGTKQLRRSLHRGWAFQLLGGFLHYKAELRGVPVTYVDPRNTSRTCPRCTCVSARNRPTRSRFRCTECAFQLNADLAAARNIAARAEATAGSS